MGACGSKQQVDVPIPEEQQKVKLLLLGTGESGKSTFVKQLKIIHANGFSDKEREEFKSAIINNIIYCIRALITGAETIGAKVKAKESSEVVMQPEYDILSNSFPDELVDHIKKLWKDKGIQKAYAHRSEFQLYDSAKYFFDEIDRIADSGYLPTTEDVLRVRVKTTGISEIEFKLGETNFLVVDVGGQRNERRKWIHCFDNVNAILFLVSLSEYDLVCFEDSTTNRMEESIKIFSETVNNPSFENISFILFLNKNDLFVEKIHDKSLTVCFPEYEAPDDEDELEEHARNYIKEQFLKESKNTQRTIVTHVICATDTDLVKRIFDSVKNIIIKQVLSPA